MLSRKLFSLSLFLSLILFNSRVLLAIGEDVPIIAVANNNIYAVSPVDGEARLLVERDPVKDAQLEAVNASSSLQLSPISPDNTKFAYTSPLYELLDPVFKGRENEISNQSPRDITLVDIATGELTALSDQGAHFAEAVKSNKVTSFSNLAWSFDGQRLYFLVSVKSLRNRLPQKTIEYYDLASGTRQVLTKLDIRAQVTGIYGVEEGVLVLTGEAGQGEFEWTLYDPDGTLLNTIQMPLKGTLDCTNYTLFTMNPVVYGGRTYYGYYSHESVELIPDLLDVGGESIPLEEDFWPALVSHTNPDTSLRLVFDGLCEYNDSTRWNVTDVNAEPVYGIDLRGIEELFEMSLSPDGQSVAKISGKESYYDAGPIVVMDINGERELDFEASEIRWGAIDFTFAQIFHRG